MRAAACLLVALAIAVAGCGSDSAGDVLGQTADNLGTIRSGDLTFRLAAATKGGPDVGFELQGPFALAKPGGLPVTDMSVTRLAGGAEQKIELVSTGRKAFVTVGGSTYELPPSRVESLRTAGAARGGGLETLDIGKWTKDPTLSNGGTVAGTPTDHVHARLDVVQATNDLLALLSSLGAGSARRISGRDADQLRRAVRSASIDVFTGKEDRLLRRLTINADLRANAPAAVRRALGALGEVTFRLELAIAHPNRPVHVSAPADAQPLPG